MFHSSQNVLVAARLRGLADDRAKKKVLLKLLNFAAIRRKLLANKLTSVSCDEKEKTFTEIFLTLTHQPFGYAFAGTLPQRNVRDSIHSATLVRVAFVVVIIPLGRFFDDAIQ